MYIRGITRNGTGTALALMILSACAILALEPELRLAIPLLTGISAVMAMLLATALYYGERGRAGWSLKAILAVALLLRLMFLFSPPQLSDDIYRYLWDGSSMLRGDNPYAHAPAAVQPSPKMADVHSRINHPGYVTIYPPAAQLIFAGGALFGGSIIGLKACLVLIDLLLCYVMIRVLRQLDMPVWRAVLYAWNPLPVLEIAGSGHVDGAGMAMVMGSLVLVLAGSDSGVKNRGRFCTVSGALIACAGMVKLFPFVLVPLILLLVPLGCRRHFLAGFVVALAALVTLFLPQLGNIFSSLDIFARNWEFAGCLFSALRSVTGSGNTARLILSSTFLLVTISIFTRTSIIVTRQTTPTAKAHQVVAACYATAMAFLLLTPTLQPWYALSLAVFLPFCAGPAGLVVCWVVFLTYQVQIPYFILGQWIENPYVTAAVFLAPVTAWLLVRLTGRVKKRFSSRPIF